VKRNHQPASKLPGTPRKESHAAPHGERTAQKFHVKRSNTHSGKSHQLHFKDGCLNPCGKKETDLATREESHPTRVARLMFHMKHHNEQARK
jgi:hypothetical protein